MTLCAEHQEPRVLFGGRVRCLTHHRLGNQAASARYGSTAKGQARYGRYNLRRELRNVRGRIALKVERLRQLETELGVFARG